jgi:hypothetical protein
MHSCIDGFAVGLDPEQLDLSLSTNALTFTTLTSVCVF